MSDILILSDPRGECERIMRNHFDFFVIGGGSAGFNAARVSADLGRTVGIADSGAELGGLCILRGCMPSKTLLYSTDVLHLAQNGRTLGLRIPSAKVDMKALHARKKRIIGEFADYRVKALNSSRYRLFTEAARFLDENTIELASGTRITADRFMIATGSKVSVPDVPGLRDAPAWTSDDVLDLDFVPDSVIVLGGGIVACELSQFLRRIGSRVILIQRSAHILRDHSPEASETVQQAFRDEGIELFTDTKLSRIQRRGDTVSVSFEHKGKTVTKRARHLFNALGRSPLTEGLNLEAAGVQLTPKGRIGVNRWQQTNRRHIYVGGDV
ncbi:MAG TPA: NAD(P)/FAD-dependent oxidoreductase, partial [Opitutaceae bacterium]|nr:NAD(P)/FAD-dependent oxidoreductase [Opitutaceae bacterium]